MRLSPARLAFGLAVLLFGFALWHDARTLPDLVASHFDAAGRADGTMPRRAHLAFFGGFGGGMSLFLLGVCWSVRLFPASTLNVPHADYWRRPENHPRACRFLFEHAFWIAAFTLLWLLGLHRQIAAANRLPIPHLDGKNMTVLGIAYGVGLALWIGTLWLYFRKRRDT